MSSAVSMIGPKFYAWDSATGKPLAFGKVYTYAAGTNTPKPTWQSEDGVTQNTNPVILNAAGYADIYLRGRYKIVVKDADDVEVWTSDPVSDASSLLQPWIEETAATQVAPDQFKITGNKTDVFRYGRSVKLDDSVIFFGTVITSVYLSGETFVTIDAVDDITSDLLRVWASLVDLESLLPVLDGDAGETIVDAVTTSLATFIPRMEQRFNLLLANSGYEFIGSYQAGVEITEYNQVLRDTGGELWRASAVTDLPYTTTGLGLPEGGAMIPIGDADIRNDLINEPANGRGALLVRGSLTYVDTIADLKAIPTSELVDGQQFQVKEYNAGTGKGGGEFYWDAASTEADNGGTVFLPSTSPVNGRWIRFDIGYITPYMFGAKGDGISDDSTILQSFFDFDRNYTGFGDWYGFWAISQTIYWYGQAPGTRKISKAGTLICLSAMDTALVIDAMYDQLVEGYVSVIGTGGNDYSTRTVTDGVYIKNAGGTTFEGFWLRNFLRWGAYTDSGGNCIFADFGRINARNCGSAPSSDTATWAKRFAFTARSDTGSALSPNQRSVLTLNESPSPLQVISPIRIGFDFYSVEAVDTVNNTISVYPWLSDLTQTSGTIHSMHGGAFNAGGVNTASTKIRGVDALRCGSALGATGLYGPSVTNLLGQVTGATLYQKNQNYGLVVDNFHPETPVDYCVDYLKADIGESRTTISGLSVLRPSEYKQINPKTSTGVDSYKYINGLSIFSGNAIYTNDGNTQVRDTSVAASNSPDSNRKIVYNRTVTSVDLKLNQDMLDRFNYSTVEISRWGDNLNYTPGATTININTDDQAKGITINGGSSLTVKSYSYNYVIKLTYEPATLAWLVGVYPSVDPAAV